jgi:glycosyltransferase involved in cell wall biosynthesis
VRVLLVHNHYQQPGGEDQVFATEARLLASAGHEVETFTLHNDAVRDMSRLALTRATLWNSSAHAAVRERVLAFQPDVVHAHNTFPLLSPGVLHAAHDAGAKVVQTLHNYRLVCPGANLFRAGKICEDCGSKAIPWPAVLHACYRDSRLASAGAASMLALHRGLGTWSRKVHAYIALSAFAKRKLVELGLPAEKLHVKPNALDPAPAPTQRKEPYGLYVGRLAQEKGVATLLEALRLRQGDLPVRFVGSGPLEGLVRQAAERSSRIVWLGARAHDEVLQLLGAARFAVVPSEWYEPFGLVVIEAFACGTPVVAARVGALHELIRHRETGCQFEPGNALDLARQLDWLEERPDDGLEIAKRARTEYEAVYGTGANLARLEAIYAAALGVGSHEARAS